MGLRNRRRRPLKGLFIGALSGLAGTIVMTQFQKVWNSVSEEGQHSKAANKVNRTRLEKQKSEKEKDKEDSTMKAAVEISEQIGHPLSRVERKKAGPWVHYAFGTSVGAIFGLAKEMEPDQLRGINPLFKGAAYGAAVFLVAHEFAVPALKLSANPLKEPISDQIAEFLSHLIYGIGTALMYDGINKVKG